MTRRARRQAARRRRVVVAAVGAVVLAGGIAWAVVGSSSHSTRAGVHVASRARPSPTTATVASTTSTAPATSAAPPSTSAPAGPPYGVGVIAVTLHDPSRPGPARGDTPATPSRSIAVTIRYPSAAGAGGGDAANAPPAAGAFPLVVFAHGFDVSAATYATLEHQLAAAGFVVAAPDFVLSSSAFPGPAVETDIQNQARDVSYVIASFDGGTGLPALLAGHVAAGKAGVVGHSDGGTTVAEAAGNVCCADPRIGAAAVLSGDDGRLGGPWFAAGGPPLLVVQGTADTINPPSLSDQVYADDATGPRRYVDILGAGHLEPYTTGPQEGAIATLVIAFLRAELQGAPSATVDADANVPGVLSLVASAP